MEQPPETITINGREYRLSKKMGGGKEGTVFAMETDPNYVVKLIDTRRMRRREIEEVSKRLKWLKDVIGNNPELKNKLAVPKGIVDNGLGYLMVHANEHDSLQNYITYPTDDDFSDWYKKHYKFKKRLQICSFLFNALESIHIAGLIFSDLSPNNIMVHRNRNNLIFIDTDNLRRKNEAYAGVAGTWGYMAPEICRCIDKSTRKGPDKAAMTVAGKLSVDSDVFSAAVIAFQLLTLQHPFIGDLVEDGPAEGEAKAFCCETDYILLPGTKNASNWPFVKFFDRGLLGTTKIKSLFERTFVAGKEQPSLRPTAVEFAEAFSEAVDMLVKCPGCEMESLYSPGPSRSCWDCGKEIEKPVCFRINNIFEKKSAEQIVAEIVRDEIDDFPEGRSSFFYVLSQMVLAVGETKHIYLRHLEKTSKRGDLCASITLTDKAKGLASLQIPDNSRLTDCTLWEKKTNEPVPLEQMPVFPIDEYLVLFERTDSRIGKISTFGSFRR